MGVFEMVVFIVSISVTGGIINKWIETKKGGLGGDAAKRLERQEAELEALKKRIRNLETMVALEPSERLGASTDEPLSLEAYEDRLENQLAKQKKRTR
jgi:hypothetical protein